MSEPQKVLCHEFKASMFSTHPLPIDVLIGRLRAAGGVQAEIGVPGDAGIQDIASMAGRIKGTYRDPDDEYPDQGFEMQPLRDPQLGVHLVPCKTSDTILQG